MEETLKGLGYLGADERVKLCCRTDSGVSALSQVALVPLRRRPILGEINSALPGDVVVWAYVKTPNLRSVRTVVTSKEYRYYLWWPKDLNLDALREASSMLIGEREYGGFVKGRRKKAWITEVDVCRAGEFLVFRFVGRYFAWQLVRRLVSGLLDVALGKLSLGEFAGILKGGRGMEPAPSWGLILFRVETHLDFTVDGRALERVMTQLNSKIAYNGARYMLFKDAMNFLRSL